MPTCEELATQSAILLELCELTWCSCTCYCDICGKLVIFQIIVNEVDIAQDIFETACVGHNFVSYHYLWLLLLTLYIFVG